MAIEAYGTVAGLEAYAQGYGRPIPESADLAAALARGSLYIDTMYGDRLKGRKADPSQFLEFPRRGETTIPRAVEYAAYEAALVEATTPFALSKMGTLNKRILSVGAGSARVQFADTGLNSLEGEIPIISTVEAYMRPFLRSVAATGIMVV